MAAIKFETIWRNYPNENPCIDAKSGKPPTGFSNQCAMRVGYALQKSGVSFESFKGNRCPKSERARSGCAGTSKLAWPESL